MPYTPFGRFGQPFKKADTMDFRNIRGGVITSKEMVIAGGTQGVIRSQNYDSSSELGWAVFGDGSADFYGDVTIGEDAVILGDLYSGNWDGAIPANLASADGTANDGYYFDSSVGSGQMMGDLFIGSDITLLSGGVFQTAASGDRIEIGGDKPFIELYDASSGLVGQIGWSASGFGTDDLTIENQSGLGNIELHSAGIIELDAGGSGGFGVMITNPQPDGGFPGKPFAVDGTSGSGFRVWDSDSPATPTWTFENDTDTGIFRHGTNQLGFAAGGNDAGYFDASGHLRINGGIFARNGGSTSVGLGFQSDTDTGFSRPASNEIWFVTGGTTQARFDGPLGQFLVQNTGANARPDIGFWDDTDTGMRWVSSGRAYLLSNAAISIEWRANQVYLWGARNNTTASGANTLIQSADGRIFRSTSSARYKKNIKAWDFRHSVLDLDPVLFRSTSDGDDSRKNMLGLIAEQVAEEFPLASIKHEGKPEAIDWNMIITGLLAEVKTLTERVEALEAALQN